MATRKRPRGNRIDEPSGSYRREEALLIFAALKEGPPQRSGSSARILELAELIGRSPGSISFKLAGYRALDGGDSPRTRRVSWVQRAVRMEFDGRTEALLAEAKRVRARTLRSLASARIEWSSVNELSPSALDGIVQLAQDTGFPHEGCLLYDHGRGEFRGVALSSTQILRDPARAARFARQLRQRAGRAARASAGYSLVEREQIDAFVRGIFAWKFPTLHLAEIPQNALLRLGAEVARPDIHRLVITPDDSDALPEVDRAEFCRKIPQTLGLAPARLCPTCVVLLGYLAGQIERKGSVHPG